jgi:hypothetical protein
MLASQEQRRLLGANDGTMTTVDAVIYVHDSKCPGAAGDVSGAIFEEKSNTQLAS